MAKVVDIAVISLLLRTQLRELWKGVMRAS